MAYHAYTYGALTLPFSRLSVSEQIIYADDGITQSATRYTFTIVGVIASVTQSAFQSLVYQMRCQLQAPRQALSISWSPDNSTFYPIYQYSTANDIDYGPKPGELNIDQFAGGLSGTYTFRITATAKDCFASCNPALAPTSGAGILSLSRNYTHTVDENGFTTRTVSGVLTIDSNTAFTGQRPADAWRDYVTPLLPKNFRRISESYTASSNGLSLQYSVSDKEMMWTFAPPITSGRASFGIHQNNLGTMVTYSLTGTFGTSKNHTKADLFTFIINLMMSRFPNNGLQGGTPAFIWSSRSITESVFDNELSFNFSGSCAGYAGDPNNPTDQTWLKGMGGVPPGSNGLNNAIGAYGADCSSTGGGGIQAPVPAIFDGCAGGLQPGGQGTTQNPPTNTTLAAPTNPATPPTQPIADPTSPGTVTNLTQDHQTAPYISVSESLSFEGNNYIRMYPSKVEGKAALLQQTANPTVTLIQAGYITRDDPTGNNPPTVPKPYYQGISPGSAPNAQGAYVDSWYISPAVSQPLAVVNQVRWSLSYRFVMKCPGPVTSVNNLGIAFPQDPRLTTTAPVVPTLPELVVTSIT